VESDVDVNDSDDDNDDELGERMEGLESVR
jgi:hypothetical protein